MVGQPGFWDLDERYARLSAVGYPAAKQHDIAIPMLGYKH